MRKFLLLALLTCFVFDNLSAQTYNVIDSVDANNIDSRIFVNRGIFESYLPTDTNNFINGIAEIWISGYDGSSQLHISAGTGGPSDYWPGPLEASDTITLATANTWAKIWKVKTSDIQYFLSLATHTIANTPPSILSWPGKGNIYAQGAAGAMLTITSDMAPFIDLNGNGIYEPLLGEYPDIKGDQAAWWVFSDNGPSHSETNGKPMGIEIHAASYAYKRNTFIDNVVYTEYTLINRSPNTYNNFRAGLYGYPQLGGIYNDYIGFDSVWRMGITYQALKDDGSSGGHPVNIAAWKPVSAVTMVVSPGDVGTSYVPAGSFTYFIEYDTSAFRAPIADTQYNNYMRAKLADGSHLTNDFLGSGVPSTGHGTGPNCNYVFTGDPSDSSKWSECVCNNDPYPKKQFILSSGDNIFPAGGTIKIVYALLTTYPDSDNYCSHTSYSEIKIVADTAWADYFNPPAAIPSSVNYVGQLTSINIYPNPAQDKVYIESSSGLTSDESVTIYNSIGQVVSVSITRSNKKDVIHINSLLPGPYHILYRNGDQQKSATFIKE